MQPLDLDHDKRPETTYITIEMGKLSEECEENIEKAENKANTSTRRKLADCLQPLFRHKKNQSQQRSQHDRAVVEETLDNDGITSERIDKNLAGSSSDTGDSMLSDETLKSNCYSKDITGVPVQESSQVGGDDTSEEKQHTYALLNHSLSKDSGLGTNETEIYNKAQFHIPAPQTDPTYNRLPADRRSVIYNYLRNIFES